MTTTRDGAEPPAVAVERPPDRGGDAEARPPARVPGPAAPSATVVLPQLLRIVGTIVAPTTLLTSLLFYFGWLHAWYFFAYFGVNSTLLDLTIQDYLIRSRDGLFVPMTVLACAALLVLWGHAVVRTRLAAGARPRALRFLLPAAAFVGLVLVAAGLTSVFVTTVLSRHLAAAPLSLAAGVLLLAYAVHLRRSLGAAQGGAKTAARTQWAAVAEWAAVFVVVGLSLFWAANDYSAAVGTSRARQVVAELPVQPAAVLYSKASLSLHAPGVREARCQDPEAAYRFRYDGLTLVLRSGDQYVFLPRAWSTSNGVAIVMPRSDALRLEFVRASARGATQRATC
jgi:hypothetical protein